MATTAKCRFCGLQIELHIYDHGRDKAWLDINNCYACFGSIMGLRHHAPLTEEYVIDKILKKYSDKKPTFWDKFRS